MWWEKLNYYKASFFLFVGLRIWLKKKQVGRPEKNFKKNIVFQDCHNDNMSQKYLL
jgi:hypothetical protein